MGGSGVGGQRAAMRSVTPVDGTELVPDDFRLWVDPGGLQVPLQTTSCLLASQYLSAREGHESPRSMFCCGLWGKVQQVTLPANPG